MKTFTARLTGNLLEGNVEVELLYGVTTYARPAFPFPFFAVPSPAWLEKYKDKFLALLTCENGVTERLLWIGVVPLEGIELQPEGLEGTYYLLTDKYRVIIDDNKNELAIDVMDKGKLLLGSQKSQEPGVLGKELATLLGKLIDEITKITVPTNVGPSTTPINTPQLVALKQEFEKFQSKITFLE